MSMYYSPEGEEEQDVADPVEVDEEISSELDENEDESFEEEEEIEEESDGFIDESEEGEEDQEPAEPVKEDKEPLKQDKDDDAKYAQARREAELEVKIIKQQQDEFAKSFGYDSFDEMQKAQKAQKYVDNGYDEETAKKLVENEEIKARLAKLENEDRIKVEKQSLNKKRFFKELEPEIDEMLKQNPSLPTELVFDVIRGRKFEELMDKEKKSVKQKTLNDSKGKAHMKPDSKGANVSTATVNDEEYSLYKQFSGDKALSRTEYAKWKMESDS